MAKNETVMFLTLEINLETLYDSRMLYARYKWKKYSVVVESQVTMPSMDIITFRVTAVFYRN